MDLVLVVTTVLVALVGVVMVYTATRGELLSAGLDPHYYLKRQLLFVLLGVVAMAVLGLIDYRRLEPWAMAMHRRWIPSTV